MTMEKNLPLSLRTNSSVDPSTLRFLAGEVGRERSGEREREREVGRERSGERERENAEQKQVQRCSAEAVRFGKR